MKTKKDKAKEQPEIYALKKNKDGFSISRKEFLGTLGVVGVGLSLTPAEAFADKIEDTGQNLTAFKAHADIVSTVCFSPDGKTLASGSGFRDSTVKIWNLPDGQLIENLEVKSNKNSMVCFSADGNMLAAVSMASTFKLWSVPDYEVLKFIDDDSFIFHSIAFNPDDQILAFGGTKPYQTLLGEDNISIILWSVPDKKVLTSMGGYLGTINAMDFSPDGNLLASGSADGNVTIWSVPDGQLIKTLEGHYNGTASVAFSPDGKILASGGADYTIKLWSVPDGNLLKTIEAHSNVNSVCFSPDGKTLATGCSDSTIKLWSVPQGDLIIALADHTNDVLSVCFSPDGKTLASGSSDNTIRLWTMPAGDPVYLLYNPALIKQKGNRKVRQMGPETITLPCGTPLPEGAVCICDCIASLRSYPGPQTVCTCDTITMAAGSPLAAGMVCVCDTIDVGTNTAPAPSPTYSTYWYPN